MILRALLMAALLGGALHTLPANAVPIDYTYDWTATNVQSSNGTPPPVNPTTLSGFFTISLDTDALGTVVDAAVSDMSPFSTDSGAVIDSANAGYTVAFQTVNTRRISVGGLISGAAVTIGLSDDLRIEFFVDWIGGAPTPQATSVQIPFIYTNSSSPSSPGGGAFTGDLQIALRDPNTVPSAPTLPLLLAGLAAAGIVRRHRG